MATKTTVNVRTDMATKKSAQRVFKKMGLDLSTGINLYLNRIVQDETLPFVPRTSNGLTREREARMRREASYAEKHGKKYTADALMREFFK
jgi:addiction module RelB/DinJ family antitoxin